LKRIIREFVITEQDVASWIGGHNGVVGRGYVDKAAGGKNITIREDDDDDPDEEPLEESRGHQSSIYHNRDRYPIVKNRLRQIVREEVGRLVREDKPGKGACPDTGCIKKSGDKWRIISNKTGKLWPQKYKTKKSAEDALKAYHV